MPEPKILAFDIETSLSRGYFFDLYKEGNIVEIDASWYMLCFSYQWIDRPGSKVYVYALSDFPDYGKNKTCDKKLVTRLRNLISEADIVCGHNIRRFDLRKANARFVAHGLAPPSPYKVIDTLAIARKVFKFDSNRLDDLGAYLGVGRKKPTTGKALWLGCMSGDLHCWKQMKAYCQQDTKLWVRVYDKLKAWHTTHPDLTYYTRDVACPVCQSDKLQKDGFEYLRSGKRQRMGCTSCGHKFKCGGLIKDAA